MRRFDLDRDAWAAMQAALTARHEALDTPAKRAEAAAIYARWDAAVDAAQAAQLPYEEYVRRYDAARREREAALDELAKRAP